MTILDRIVADTRELVVARKQKTPVGRLLAGAGFSRSPLALEDALARDGLSIIGEIKKASPSKGVIRPDFQPGDIARAYERAGAAAISILTEPFHFKGSLDDLSAVRDHVSLPLLRKDFIIDAYQLYEARASGADAVLLIAAVLDRMHLGDLLQAAGELGLSALVEVYELPELDRIDFDAVSIVGVNNRDLRTFEVDVDHSVRVFAHVPETVLRVSESGLSSAAELKYLHEHGVDAVLIGETFMRDDEPGRALAQLKKDVERIESV